jgi:hypothetical protein
MGDACEEIKEAVAREIEAIRRRMMELGDEYGLDDQRVLSASRELDALIVFFHRLAKT